MQLKVALLYFAGVAGAASAFSKTELNNRRFGPDHSVVGGAAPSSLRLSANKRITSVLMSSRRSDGSYPDGEELAKQFYDHLKTRDATTAPVDENEEYRRLYRNDDDEGDDDDEAETYDLLPEDEARRRNREPFANRREVRQGKYDIPAPLSSGRASSSSSNARRKFTGRASANDADAGGPRLDSTGTPSAGLFSGDGSSVFSIPADRVRGGGATGGANTPRARMMQQEFNLVGRATSERTLAAQAAIVLLFLSFSIYVGLSGGITDGSERFGLEPSELNGLGEALDFGSAITGSAAFEEAVQATTSSGGSVWL